MREGDLPVVVGGDHTCAIGTWKGVAHALQDKGRIGLLWIDAHMDAHTPQTTETGMLHGMPVAALLGYGYPELTRIAGGVRLDPNCVCLYGVRSFERGEAEFLARLGVRVFLMSEIAERGVAVTLNEAVSIVGCANGGFGITLDMDAIDPLDAPGVGTPEAGGLRGDELIRRSLHMAHIRTSSASRSSNTTHIRIALPQRPASSAMRSMRCSSDNRGFTPRGKGHLPRLNTRQADAREIRFEGRQHHDVRRGRRTVARFQRLEAQAVVLWIGDEVMTRHGGRECTWEPHAPNRCWLWWIAEERENTSRAPGDRLGPGDCCLSVVQAETGESRKRGLFTTDARSSGKPDICRASCQRSKRTLRRFLYPRFIGSCRERREHMLERLRTRWYGFPAFHHCAQSVNNAGMLCKYA